MTDQLRELINRTADFSEPAVTTSTSDERTWLPSNHDDDGT
jgi:hypothetical protein